MYIHTYMDIYDIVEYAQAKLKHIYNNDGLYILYHDHIESTSIDPFPL